MTEIQIEDRDEEEVAGYSRITCHCGFVVVGQDEGHNVEAFVSHSCPSGFHDEERWYHSVFSIWTVFIVIAVGYVLVEVVKAFR